MLMSKEEILIKKCERGMKTLIEESKPWSKTAIRITVEIPDQDSDEAEEHSWLHFNNLFKEKRHPTSHLPEII